MVAAVAENGGLRMVVPASTDSLAVSRQVIAGVGDSMGLTDLEIADLKLIVSEAVGNAVRHGYQAEDGSGAAECIELVITLGDDLVTLTVCDEGVGFLPAASSGDSLGLGIPLMASIAQALELRAREGGGVQLRAEIAVGERRERHEGRGSAHRGPVPGRVSLGGGSAVINLNRGALLGPILARMIGICAARVGLTVDELSDSLLVSDAVTAKGVWADETELRLEEDDQRAQLTIGPLASNGGQALIDGLEVPGVGSLARLATDVSVEVRDESDAGPAGEYLILTITGQSQPAV